MMRFAEEYNELGPGEQSLFADAVRRVLADGLIWRENEDERRVYHFLVRRRDLVSDYLAVAGWELRFDERVGAFHVVHRDGAHRRRLSREQTIWLLLLRLMYAEKRERLEASLTRFPVVPIASVVERYAEFFPGQVVRKRASLTDALRSFQTLKLIRAAGGAPLRSNDVDQLIELLPTLEIVVPSGDIAALAERVRSYDRAANDEEAADEA